jgi:hypothetical protein
MNFHWLWLEWLQSLPITGKVAIIAAHILVVLLIMLYAIATSQRGNTNKAPMAMPYSVEPAVKLVQTTRSSPKKGKLYNTNKRVRHLLNIFCNNNLIKHLLYYEAYNGSENPTQDIRWHIRHIVNKLRRRVNESGKEPILDSAVGDIICTIDTKEITLYDKPVELNLNNQEGV